jgi:hypothetical protein
VGDNGTGAGISATNGGTFTLTGSTLTNNTANGEGGGLYRFRDATSGGDDTVTGTRFAGNQATYAGGAMSLYTNLFFGINSDDISGNSIGAQGPGGGGIFAEDATAGATSGAVSIANTTITGNNATAAPLTQDGGGLLAGTIRPLDLDISYSTISQNNASDQGGNLAFKGNTTVHPTLSFVSSIVSGGTATNTPASSNCFFTSAPNGVNVASTGGNVEDTTPSQCAFLAPPMGSDVVGANPLLGSLANNGGPTKTLALQTGSPAIGLGASPCPPTDQRGYPRPGLGGSSCDSGAYELSVCNGAAVTDPTPPTGCPSPPSDGGSTPPPPATSTSPPPAGAPAKKKCKKRKRRAAAAKKCKRRKTS